MGTLALVPCLFLSGGMTLLLRKSSAQARIEGWDSGNWPDDDYAVVEDTIVGLIYREMIIGKPKWRWFLQQIPEAGPGRSIPPPNQGMADRPGCLVAEVDVKDGDVAPRPSNKRERVCHGRCRPPELRNRHWQAADGCRAQ
jgi:hypothetical protein